jgi:hypothetical protein
VDERDPSRALQCTPSTPGTSPGLHSLSVVERDPDARIASAREAIIALADRFAETARRQLEAALDRSMERLVVRCAEWFNRLDNRTAQALREAVRQTIQRGAARVEERLKDTDLWLSPSVVVDAEPQTRLDDPANRVWIALLNAADPLDPILTEFGLDPSDVPDQGGGHFGLQPETAGEVDPRGTLASLWARYRKLYAAYQKSLRMPVDRREREDREQALRRWNEPN